MAATHDIVTILTNTSNNTIDALSNDIAFDEFNFVLNILLPMDQITIVGDELGDQAINNVNNGPVNTMFIHNGMQWTASLEASYSVSQLSTTITMVLENTHGYSLRYVNDSGVLTYTDNHGTNLTVNNGLMNGTLTMDQSGDFAFDNNNIVSVGLTNVDASGSGTVTINGDTAVPVSYSISAAAADNDNSAVSINNNLLNYTPALDFIGVDTIGYVANNGVAGGDSVSSVTAYVGQWYDGSQWTFADVMNNVTIGISLTDSSYTVMIDDLTITEVVEFRWLDQTTTLIDLQNNDDVRPLFASPEYVGGEWVNQYLLPDEFSAPGNPGLEALYDYQYFGDNDGNILVASDDNDFINGFGGDDAINTGAGNDIIDGGLGSNFLTGGSGNDTFFSDGRGAVDGAITWSTITDFTDGTNSVNIWGYVDGVSSYQWYAGQGAAGYTGATVHADIDGDGLIDTSMTFTGMTESQLTVTAHDGAPGYFLIG